MKYSIIIPTYNHKELLKGCIDSIIEFTDLTKDVEIVVVCNGCQDGSYELMQEYRARHNCIKSIYWPEPLGFSKAINMGIIASKGEYVILLNNDCKILGREWLDTLYYPFSIDSATGMTGPALQTLANGMLGFIFFCVMLKRDVVNTIGYLDEEFEIGHGEDTDYTIRAVKAGFKMHQVPYNNANLKYYAEVGTIHGNFPIYHESFQTRKRIPDMENIMKKNIALLKNKHNF